MKLDKFTWQKKLRGADLTKAEYCVLMNISTYTGPDLKGATMSVATIASDCRIDVRWAQRLIKSLQQKGFLLVTVGGNAPGNTNTYEVTLPSQKGAVAVTTPTGGETSQKGVVKRAPMGGETSQKGVVAMTTQPEYSPEKAPERASDAADAADEFKAWFKAYPKQEQENKAKAAYIQALSKTDAATLLAAVNKYREKLTRDGTGFRWVKLPATWLSAECWRDFELVTFFDKWGNERTMPRWEKEDEDKKAQKAAAGGQPWF